MSGARFASLLLVLVLAAVPAPLLAASDGATVGKFGLLGTWAIDCSNGSSGANPYENFSETATGEVTFTLILGPNMPVSHHTISDAALVGGDRLKAKFTRLPDGHVTFVTLVNDHGKLHSAESTETSGNFLIRDGRFAGSNSPVPIFEYCSK